MSSPYTNYPDIVTSAGIPLIGSGNIPVTNGKYWFVDSVNGADANNGSNTATPFKTITQAVAVALTNDVILVMPGTYTEAVTVSVAGIHIIGISTTTHPVSWTSATDTVTCAITAANVEVASHRHLQQVLLLRLHCRMLLMHIFTIIVSRVRQEVMIVFFHQFVIVIMSSLRIMILSI